MQAFAAPYAPADETVVPKLVARATLDAEAEARVDARARALVLAIRKHAGKLGGLEDFLRDYGLSTKEGLALMVMAEALLRVPDAETQDALIEDKIGAGDWSHMAPSETWFVSAATWGLGLSTRIVRPGESPHGILAQTTKRIGAPAVRTGVRQAMRFLGHQFVLGETIEAALKRAKGAEDKGDRHSYDMLGEGARTWDDARRYAKSYADAITAIGRAAGNKPLPQRPGISVKLSALHPRYEARNRENVLRELVPVVLELAQAARSYDLNFTVDAEEQERLELSLDVVAAVFEDDSLRDWDGFGLAVQAYAKRALPVIDWVADLAEAHGARMMVRLVKGAYWDAEVKHAQMEGQGDFPVFTRKPATDVSFLACARRMLERRDVLFPQIATHNALTVAAVLEMADASGDRAGFEFQRLHGMGEALYEAVRSEGVACRVYAPVGGHRDLLAYLVRRLLENGANSSFVAKVGDRKVPIAELLERPATQLGDAVRHGKIPLPSAIFAPRKNSVGMTFGDRKALAKLVAAMRKAPAPEAVAEMAPGDVDRAMRRAQAAFAAWRDRPVVERAGALRRAADLLEARRAHLMAVLAREAGKTIDDGVAEVREAVDFLRYYADEAERLFRVHPLPGPAGEENVYAVRGRGVWLAVAPWNFPLAIFLGQVAAALAAGNAVVAKPAPQTPAIGKLAVALLHEAGVPEDICVFAPGVAELGQALVEHPLVAGVAFTGSDPTARRINRTLAGKDGPIVPLIAETGGVNAMIADATALPEQVADAVVMSAFRSAGQRCSACRILYVQEDVADRIVAMIEGAAATLHVGDGMDPATDVGPIIDDAALARLEEYVAGRRVRFRAEAPEGRFMGPVIVELDEGERLEQEVFGPVLHVKRFRPERLGAVLEEIDATGYGLTFGLHSRIDTRIRDVCARVGAGNVYVNRNQIGAIVGSQPFGGRGRSGTGPKAGGPLYLTRFVEERVVSTDTTAAGGNASLIAMGDG
ncbi:L-glutamate gamma-semialdehyde dehydrogenase [Jannaschia sp. W003]|uniref:L-glutamate gamma-semialdehyde dehydrogenase n=1 Tax=Jannaschia sp. W003 TaxID=2867012 RepID=UPI0021A826E8|nr:L-glutamate gamma-semialdehyde dehydrogenase [Jannaschia sp. W003]UWQ21501.1 L-glutamate gamma-semialdehyde dehydrogenase [Jannaschia sp. W003]